MMTEISFLLFLLGFVFLPCLSQGTEGWTEWFDTDSPADDGDYENVVSIKQRGYYICDGNPVMSQCRVSGTDEIFSDQTYFSNNHLIVPCSNEGLVCNNAEQGPLNKCHNFEVRFYCEESDSFGADEASVIGLAAGISVLLPILCVVSVHVYKSRCRKRRQSPSLEEPQTTHEERSAVNNDAPPSYETLFADGTLITYGSHEALLDLPDTSRHNANNVRTGHINHLTSVSDESNSRDSDVPSVPSTQENNSIFHISNSDITVQNINTVNNGFRRLPGMHLSIIDLLYQEDHQITPPPTYDEAIVIIQEKS